MLKIFSEEFNNIGKIKSAHVRDNTLYMLNDNNRDPECSDKLNNGDIGIFLIKIDLIKRSLISKEMIAFSNKWAFAHNSFYSIDDYIYNIKNDVVYTKNVIDNTDERLHKVKYEDVKNNSLINTVKRYVHIRKINGKICYLVGYATLDRNNSICDNCILIKDLLTNEVFYKIMFFKDKVDIINNEIHLPFKLCNISSYDNILIFSDKDKYVKVNLTTKEYYMKLTHNILKLNPLRTSYVYMNTCLLFDYEKCKGDNDKNVTIMYDLVNDTYKKFTVNYHIHDSMSFKYNGKRHHLFIEKKEDDKSYVMYIYIDEDDLLKHIDYNFVILKNDTEECKIPFHLLSQRSNSLKLLCEDIYESSGNNNTISPITLNLKGYRNIGLYIKYAKTREYDIKNIYNLFKICNHLQDCDVEYLAEMIIVRVRDKEMCLMETLAYLYLLHESTCYTQFETLMWVVHNKYGTETFLDIIKDDESLMDVYTRKFSDISR